MYGHSQRYMYIHIYIYIYIYIYMQLLLPVITDANGQHNDEAGFSRD
jgi:hypothetical protein